MKTVIVYQSEDNVYFSKEESCSKYEACIQRLKEFVDRYIGLEFPNGNTEYKIHDKVSLLDLSKVLYDFLIEEIPNLKDDKYFNRIRLYNNGQTDVYDVEDNITAAFNIIIRYLPMLTEKYYKDCINVHYKFYFDRLHFRLKNYIDYSNGVEYGVGGMKDMYRGNLESFLEWREEELKANEAGYTTLR
jgi:hypothetical protein